SAPRRRAERVEARVTSEQKQLLERAAALEGRSMTDFIIASAQNAAADTIARYEVLQLSPRDQSAFVDALLNPPAPNDALRAAAARYRTLRAV
ncbi:MAG: DUF1778 domain-containing protein, partial [Steroidobacteraceae bacterium]